MSALASDPKPLTVGIMHISSLTDGRRLSVYAILITIKIHAELSLQICQAKFFGWRSKFGTIFRNLKISNIKRTKDELFDCLFSNMFRYLNICLNYSNIQNYDNLLNCKFMEF